MKSQPDNRLLDPLVGRANTTEQSGPAAEQPPVGRATAALAGLQEALVSRMHEAARLWNETNDATYWVLAMRYQNALRPLAELEAALESIQAEEPSAANAKLSDAGEGGK